jgi:hypothetical protein
VNGRQARWPHTIRSRRWLALAATLVLVGSGSVAAGLRQHEHPLAGPATSSGSTATAPSGPPASGTSPGVARSRPVRLRIPAIGLSVSLSELGLNHDGTVEVPTDIQQPGWFDLGPTPGQEGSAVILGHVDSHQGPAVFFRLRAMKRGERVDVRLADGVTARFVVRSVVMYSKAHFPGRLVYASHGYSGLQLVTCGGTFDSQTGHYLSNIVVFTALVAPTHKPAQVAADSSRAGY